MLLFYQSKFDCKDHRKTLNCSTTSESRGKNWTVGFLECARWCSCTSEFAVNHKQNLHCWNWSSYWKATKMWFLLQVFVKTILKEILCWHKALTFYCSTARHSVFSVRDFFLQYKVTTAVMIDLSWHKMQNFSWTIENFSDWRIFVCITVFLCGSESLLLPTAGERSWGWIQFQHSFQTLVLNSTFIDKDLWWCCAIDSYLLTLRWLKSSNITIKQILEIKRHNYKT